MQALPLAQPLEAKPQTRNLSGVEVLSVPLATVAAATVTATSTLTSGQTSDTSAGMCTQDVLKHVHILQSLLWDIVV